MKCTIAELVVSVPFPAILFWNDNHFIVFYHADKKNIWVSDPAKGKIKYTHEEFRRGWYQVGESIGVLLGVEATADFQRTKAEKEMEKNSFISMLRYFVPYKKSFTTIFVIMLVVTLLQGVLPFISKAVIDVGIKTFDLNFINMVLVGNISILLSVTILKYIALLHSDIADI